MVFFIAGLGVSAWAPLVPFAKARAGLGDGVLGLLLLCLGTGSIIAMPMAGALAARFGCRLRRCRDRHGGDRLALAVSA
jgi:MFS family permease